jgi:CO/xanthine dehydrogenase Mo-binding subunit
MAGSVRGCFNENQHPVWERLPIPSGQEYAEAADHGEAIRAELAADNPARLVLERQFETQSADPMFLEPESGLGWYDAGRKTLELDAGRKTLELVVGVQSPYDAAESVAFLLGEADAAHKPARINTHFAYMGGGFGGRDHTPFPMYVALAAMFCPGRPVRLANNRFEQFQSGIKRHGFSLRTRMGVDRATGKIFAFAADHVLHAGGLANFSPHVASVGAVAALGIYYAPKVDITTVSLPSRAVTAGSMRGYGTLQLSDVAARAHAKNGITGAMAHGFNRWAWSQADFKIDGQNWTADIDALALRRGAGKFVRLDRTSVKFPPTDFTRIGSTYTTKCGTLARVEINRSTGALRIAKAYSVFECGTALVPQVVIGQTQGAFAMGVGGAFLETLPLHESGPGNGKWNLGQYLIARGSDLPLRDLEIEVLPPVGANERPKGMSEVVMNPVAAALVNAIFDATGHRFSALPVTQEMIKGVLT